MSATKSGFSIAFRTLAGVRSARVEGDEVIGRWESYKGMQWIQARDQGKSEKGLRRTMLVNPAKLAEDFANFPDSAQKILQFTKKYAPLKIVFEVAEEFRFKLAQWRKDQATFRRRWEHQQKSGVGEFERSGKGEGLAFIGGTLCYTTEILWGFLSLALLAQPRERLRKCKRPDCQNPYYIAYHLGQQYCSALCARWAQRQWKLRWWNAVGKKNRSKRVHQRRGA
jgi:hypothetical protein